MASTPPIPNGVYKIQNVQESTFLEVPRPSSRSDKIAVVAGKETNDIYQRWYFFTNGTSQTEYKYIIMSAAIFGCSLTPEALSVGSKVIAATKVFDWSVLADGNKQFRILTLDSKLALTLDTSKADPFISQVDHAGDASFLWNIVAVAIDAGKPVSCHVEGGSPGPVPGFYRIRNSNPKLCLTTYEVGIQGSNIYVDEQQEAENQKWLVQTHGDGFIIESVMSPECYVGYDGRPKKYTPITAQEEKAEWYLEHMFGTAYTIVEPSKQFAIGFSDYLPNEADNTVLINNVAAQSQVWYFEPWDHLKTDEGFLPPTDTSLKDGTYQIVNVATGFLMTLINRGALLITKQKDRDLTYSKWVLKRIGDYATLYSPAGTYMNIGPGLIVKTNGTAEEFILARQKGERGFYIMSKNETKPRRVISDNRSTPEGFEFYPVDLKKGDPTQRWEFKLFT